MNNNNPPINKPKLISDVWIWQSLLTAALVTTTSLFGILDPKTYSRETSAWAMQNIFGG